MRRGASSHRSKAAMRCRRWVEAPSHTCAGWRKLSSHLVSRSSVFIGAHGSMMQRRQFLSACAAIAGASGIGAMNGEWTSATPRLYSRSRLIDHFGEPIKVAGLATRTNYVFQYPFAGTPCFLLNLGRPLAGADKLLRADGAPYAWSGGVGRQRPVVAFSGVCV